MRLTEDKPHDMETQINYVQVKTVHKDEMLHHPAIFNATKRLFHQIAMQVFHAALMEWFKKSILTFFYPITMP